MNIEEVGGMASSGFGMGGGVAAIAVGLALMVFAFFSFKIYKIALYLIGGLGGGILGLNFVSPIIVGAVAEPAEWLPIAVAIACGVLGIILILALQKLAIFVSGAFLGFLIGNYVSVIVAVSNPEFAQGAGKWLVAIACAILVGFLSGVIFRPVFIISTSVVGGLGGAMSVSGAFGLDPAIAVVVGIALGAIVSVLAMIFQFKTTGKKKEEK